MGWEASPDRGQHDPPMQLDLPPAADRDALLVALVSMGVRTRAFLEEVDLSTATPIDIDRRAAPEWFAGVESVLDALHDYVNDAPRDVLLLCERMAARLEVADVDDSDGGMTDAMQRLEAIHADSCRKSRIPPLELEERLTRLAYASDMDAFADWRR